MAEIAVCITTHRRPDNLERVLAALAALETVHAITVIVGETGETAPDCASLALCRTLTEAGYRWPIHASAMGHRNMARVRNALIANAYEAGAPVYIALLDDRTVPDADWADGLVFALRHGDADIVMSPIIAAFEPKCPRWLARHRFFRPRMADDTSPPASLNGAMARATLFPLDRKPWFDPHEKRVRLSDPLFIAEGLKAGLIIDTAARGCAHRHYEPAEATDRALSGHAFREACGLTIVRLIMRHRAGADGWPAAEALRGLAAILTGSALMMAGFWLPPARLSARLRMARGAGKLKGVFGPRTAPKQARSGARGVQTNLRKSRI